MRPDDFIAEVSPAAKQSARETGIPASFTVADAALESGWGASLLASKAFNLFGVKADPAWKGERLAMNTREFLNGEWVMVPAYWRKYGDWLDSIRDHAQFLLTNPRYKPALDAKDPRAFARAIQAAGYATDPDYAGKVISIMRAHHLLDIDVTA